MTDTPPAPPLAADAPITRANLAQALAEIIAGLPDISKRPPADAGVAQGQLYSNAGTLGLALKDQA